MKTLVAAEDLRAGDFVIVTPDGQARRARPVPHITIDAGAPMRAFAEALERARPALLAMRDAIRRQAHHQAIERARLRKAMQRLRRR